MVEKIAAIVFSLLILLTAWCYAKQAKSWLLPGIIFSVFWFLYTFLPLIFLPNVPVNYEAVIYIFLFCQAFMVSGLFFNWTKARVALGKNSVPYSHIQYINSGFIRWSFALMVVFVIFSILYDVVNQGFSIKDIIFDLMSTSSSYIALRYSGTLQESIVTRLGTVFTYVAVMLGGFVFCFSKNNFNKFIISFVALLPSVMLMVIQGAKGALFLCMFLFYGSIIIYRLYKGETTLTNKKTNRVFFYASLLLIPAIISSFLSRGLYDQDSDYVIEKLQMYIMSYAFAHLYAFSDWFYAYLGEESLMRFTDTNNEIEYGFYTFMAIFNTLGADKYVPPGVYEEYYFYKDVIKSNIYTMYRGAILDFGVFGSFVFSFVLGLVLNCVYYLIHVLKSPILLISTYITMFGFYYTSFIISIFIWNSLYVALFVLYLVLVINKYFFCPAIRQVYD